MRSSRSLLVPAEHGTWAELLFPLLTALSLGSPVAASWAVAVAAFAGFLATEGMQVLAGVRGTRAAREQRAAAARSLAVFGVVAVAAGAAGFLGLAADARLGFVLVAIMSLAVWAAVLAGGVKSGAGEIAAAVTLPAWSVPVGLGGGVALPIALAVWAVWSASFVGATLAVRSLIARNTRRPAAASRQGALAVTFVTLAGVAILAGRGTLPAAIVIGFVPTACAIGLVSCAAIPARRLRQVGWTFVAASTLLFLALMTV